MIIDCHVHISATTPPHGMMSRTLLKSTAFKFMRWRLGLDPAGPLFDSELETLIAGLIGETVGLDAAVMLAFDAVHDREGRLDQPNTHLYVTNGYAMEMCRRHRGR